MNCPLCQCPVIPGEDCTYHQQCSRCEGYGSVMVRKARTYDPDTATPEEWDECPECQGFGWLPQ